jgi:WD40 repeat protein
VVSLITALTRRSDLELAGTYTKSARVCNGQPVYRAVHCSGGRCTEVAYLYQPRAAPVDRGGAEQRLWVVSISSHFASTCSSSGASIWLEAPDQAPPPLRPDDPAVAGTWHERDTVNPDLRIWAKWGSSCDSPQTDGGCGTHGRCVASGDRPHQHRCGCDHGWGGMRCEHDPCAAVNCTRLVSAGALAATTNLVTNPSFAYAPTTTPQPNATGSLQYSCAAGQSAHWQNETAAARGSAVGQMMAELPCSDPIDCRTRCEAIGARAYNILYRRYSVRCYSVQQATSIELAGSDSTGRFCSLSGVAATLGWTSTAGRWRPNWAAPAPIWSTVAAGASGSPPLSAGYADAEASRTRVMRYTSASGGWTLSKALRGHPGFVTSIAWAPSGRQLASSSWWDNTVTLWDPTTHKLLANLSGHTGIVHSVAWGPSGKPLASGERDNGQLASGSHDMTVKLWDPATHELLATLSGHTDEVHSVAWAPSGRQLASGSQDNTVKLWDPTTHNLLANLSGHTGTVPSVAWGPSGKLLASGSHDMTVKLWDPATHELLATLSGHTDEVRSVAWAPSGRQLASGSQDNTVKLWDPTTHQLLVTLRQTGQARSVAWSPSGRQLASSSMVGRAVNLWDPTTHERLATLSCHVCPRHLIFVPGQNRSTYFDGVRSVAWSPSGRQLALGSADTVQLWNAHSEPSLLFQEVRGVTPLREYSVGVWIKSVGMVSGVDQGRQRGASVSVECYSTRNATVRDGPLLRPPEAQCSLPGASSPAHGFYECQQHFCPHDCPSWDKTQPPNTTTRPCQDDYYVFAGNVTLDECVEQCNAHSCVCFDYKDPATSGALTYPFTTCRVTSLQQQPVVSESGHNYTAYVVDRDRGYITGVYPAGVTTADSDWVHVTANVTVPRLTRAVILSLRVDPGVMGTAYFTGGAASVASFLAAGLTEIYLCNVCSCQEMLRRNGRGQSNFGRWVAQPAMETRSTAVVSPAVRRPLRLFWRPL